VARLLIVEDDEGIRIPLTRALEREGYAVDGVADGEAALRGAAAGDHDLIIVDVGLPGMDGLEVCRRVRAEQPSVPILFLTAQDGELDIVDGLDAGADDYLPKPFDLDELLARLRALVRRGTYGEETTVQVDDLVVDPGARKVTRAGHPIELSAREFDVLRLLVERTGQVVSRYTILDEVWDGETDLRSNVIDVHLAAIRAKIDRPFGTETITTLRGAGYRVDRAPS
jgi:two-component system, OmpR family, response regulator